MEDFEYNNFQRMKFKEYEAFCKHCGFCCGADNDPCQNLIKNNSGGYDCKVYNERLGLQKTISGKWFNCILIKEVLKFSPPNPDCAYALKKRTSY
jgi:uncharacterized cysteine cluster protein YcgN (CxxCxxCC family)